MDNVINGSIVAAFIACPREAWLLSRQITADQENPYLILGRLIHEDSYRRDKKEIIVDNIKIDLMERENEEITVVGEIKKSSRSEESARMQLIFYLYKLREMGIEAKGELLFPKEKKRKNIILDKPAMDEIENIIAKIEEILDKPVPPLPQRIKYCRACAYKEFCWS